MSRISIFWNLICYLLAYCIVLYSSCPHHNELTNEYCLTSCQTPLPINHFQLHHFSVQRKFHNITTSLFIYKFWSSQPSSLYEYGIQVYLETHWMMACQCIIEYTEFWTPSAYNHGLEVYLQRYLFMASKLIPELTQSWMLSLHAHRL